MTGFCYNTIFTHIECKCFENIWQKLHVIMILNVDIISEKICSQKLGLH
jgi:hypothetical protein